MLDTKDIELLTSIFRQELNQTLNTSLDKRFAEQDTKWEKILDERFAKQDAKWEKILDERFSRQDAKWEKILDERFARQDTKWEKILDERFARQDTKWEKILDERIYKSECMLLDELDRLESRLTRRMDRMQEDLDQLNQGFRILYIERGNFQLLQERLDSYEIRLAALEKTIA
ncbi:MAG: hypothetical protein IJP31_05420 [Lachnospiraceae bacterium]|nr:hypothetical protein [Lachnospiraceae bacterium]